MVKQSEVELPIVFKNQLLFKAGNWNHISFSNDMVTRSVDNTKWSALNKRLYFKHDNQYDISQWKGKVENIRAVNGEVRGDVEIWDGNEAIQIKYGQKPIAISADVEYNDNGIMYFTGFALEADPGVRDAQMFLSDSVKNEMNGMYHAKFSNQIDTTEVKQETQTNPIDNQSAERRLINDKPTENMTENQISETQTTADKEVVNKLVDDLNKAEGPVKSAPTPEPTPTPVPKEPTVEKVEKVEPKVEPKQEGTVADKPLSTILPQDNVDEKLVNTIVDKLAEKLKNSMPQPVTINEFGSEFVDSEQETVNRLAESLAKM